jgi:hypothetical protein
MKNKEMLPKTLSKNFFGGFGFESRVFFVHKKVSKITPRKFPLGTS